MIFVPNHSCASLLRRHRVKECGIAMNVDFFFLENGLRKILKRERPWGFVNKDTLQHSILCELLSHPELVQSAAYDSAAQASRTEEMRLAELASLLAENFDNYDLHRYGCAEFQAILNADPLQSTLYRALEARVRAENIRRADEREQFFLRDVCAGEWDLHDERKESISLYGLHLFAFTALSPLHLRILRALCEKAGGGLNLWHLAPAAALQNKEYSLEGLPPIKPLGEDIGQKWTRASRSFLRAAAKECGRILIVPPSAEGAGFAAHSPCATKGPPAGFAFPPLLRIVGAPSVLREIEFVCNSILWHMRQDASLAADDFTLLMPDPAPYRPYIEMVFAGRAQGLSARTGSFLPAIPYSFIASSGENPSLYLTALQGILNLAANMSNGFSRNMIAPVLDNDCVLAACGAKGADVDIWFSWMERLGVFGGEAFSRSLPAHSWARALTRLRLGRVMRLSGKGQWQRISPYQDEETGDSRRVGILSELMEALQEEIAGLNALRLTGEKWVKRITLLLDRFIAVPAHLADGEGHIPLTFLRELADLADLPECGFPLIKSLVEAICNGMASRQNFSGRAGVRIAALSELHFAPADFIYVLGMNEGAYPQPRQHRDFDLREIDLQAHPADIDESDRQRMMFAETLLSARKGIYISYLNKDPIQDSALYPSSLISELRTLLPDQKDDIEFSLPLSGWVGPDRALHKECPEDVFATYSILDDVLSREQGIGSITQPVSRTEEGAHNQDAARARNRFSFYDFARYICNPAEGILSRVLRQEEDSLQNIIRKPAEPFFHGEAASKFFYEIQNDLRRAWLLSGGDMDPDAFLREYYNDGFRAWWEERGIIPSGVYAGNYWKRLMTGEKEGTTILSSIADLPRRIAENGRDLSAPFVFGRPPRVLRDDASGGLLGALRYPCGAEDACAISGEIPLLWREDDIVCSFIYNSGIDKKGAISKNSFARVFEYMLTFIPSFVQQFSFPAGGRIRMFYADGSACAFTLDERHERAFQFAYRALTRRTPEDFFLAPIEAICSCVRSHGRLTRDALIMELQDSLAESYGRGTPASAYRLSLAPLPSDERLQSWYDEMIAPFFDILFSGASDEDNGGGDL
jgi:hypothetical protein